MARGLKNMQEDLSYELNIKSIHFWRHIVGATLIAYISPPYLDFINIESFLGFNFGKIFSALILAGAFTFLGWLFFTDKFKNKVGIFFIQSMWIFLLIVVALLMRVN